MRKICNVKTIHIYSNDLGVLLEYLVQVKGPYELAREDVKYSLESKVYHDEIQSNHNFDVIFYLKTSKKEQKCYIKR